LSQREADVLEGILLGRTDKQIAHELKTTYQTVKVQVKAVLRKLKVSNRTEAAVLVLRAALMLPCPRCGYEERHDVPRNLVDDVGVDGRHATRGSSAGSRHRGNPDLNCRHRNRTG